MDPDSTSDGCGKHDAERSDDLTRLVHRMRQGDSAAAEELLERVYEELRRLARRQMGQQPADHSLGATVLVHEAYLRLCRGSTDVHDRNHFFNVAARAMRSVLVDHARRARSDKRTAPGSRVLLDALVEAAEERSADLLALDEALERLGSLDPRMARLVELRFFAGLGVSETASALEISPRQAAREWQLARVWLRRELS